MVIIARLLLPCRRYTLYWAIILGGLSGFMCGYLLQSIRSYTNPDLIRPSEQPTRECDPPVTILGSKKSTETQMIDMPTLGEAIADLQKKKLFLVNELHNKTRLLCWVMTEPKNHDKRAVIMETWGKRCHLLLFMVGAPDMLAMDKKSASNSSQESTIPPNFRRRIGPNAFVVYLKMAPDIYDNLWSKTRSAFVYVHEHFNDYDWVLKVDDDSFVIVENLRLFLDDKKQEEPFYYGSQYKVNSPRGYASGGPGYVLSRFNVGKFVELLKRTNVSDDCVLETTAGNGAEDSRIAQCLDKLGIGPADTRDGHGRFRYLPFTVENVLTHETLHSKYNWFWGFSAHKLANGFECCADTAISFHYITPSMMRVMEYLIYYVHPFSSRQIWNKTAVYASGSQ